MAKGDSRRQRHDADVRKQKATEDQRKAIVNIFIGKAKGEGPFALFASTVKYVLDTQFGDIAVKIDCRKSSFSIPGVLDVQLEGFIWKVADAAKTKVMCILTPNLNFDDSGKNAFVSVVEYKGSLARKRLACQL
jgi:hypothetical protein